MPGKGKKDPVKNDNPGAAPVKKADNKDKSKKDDPVKRADNKNKSKRDNPAKKSDNKSRRDQKRSNNKDQKRRGDVANLPKFITFKNKKLERLQIMNLEWPQNKTFVVDMYARSKVPVAYVKSEDTEKLEKHLSNHKQDIVVINFEFTDKVNLIEICKIIQNHQLFVNLLKQLHFSQ